ncbi:hypothetical protein B0T24DRAFT_580981 [Lasiosphaeria ovina]|uniref:Uncharacterized protein n=1 Tax=Lasiosphaeria ovina TaxID=92902 RepID=A0AAE0JZE2_9PEZI|nr:hypothetical protein B0T24DRAFT_580981 [Lasiosphaeria ovina]
MLHEHGHEHDKIVEDVRAAAAEPEQEADTQTQHILQRPGRILPLSGKQMKMIRKRFGPSLVLLKSLNNICTRVDRTEAESPPPTSYQTLKQKFHTFVSKISQICDYGLNGSSFTSCAVLQEAEGVLYLLASNDRDTQELEDMRVKLISVLDILKENIVANAKDRESDDDLRDRLLRLVLAHNWLRVRSYLTALSAALRDCVAACNWDEPSEEKILKALTHLIEAIPNLESSEEADTKYIDKVVSLSKAIQDPQHSRAGRLMRQRAAADMRQNVACWSKMQHTAGRLVSYEHAVETLIIAHHIWGYNTDLFLNFDVKCLPSSARHPRPLKNNVETADTIIGRMAVPDQLRIYRDHAGQLQMFGLDDEIARQWKTEMRPYVHAEMNLLDWLRNTLGATKPYRFFKGWQYIGSSKPTCRLCRFYFDAVAPEVEIRKTHSNLYYNWRLPDIYQDEGGNGAHGNMSEAQMTQWRDVMNKIKGRVCEDALRLLKEKVSDKKEHDSNTFTFTDSIRESNSVVALGVRFRGFTVTET